MMQDALVRWTSESIRGRRELPPTLRYVGLSRFVGDVVGRDDAWSVELRFHHPPAEQGNQEATRAQVRFLMADAPHERLSRGARFGLFEGPIHVADVEIL